MAPSLRESIPPGSLTDLVMLEPDEVEALDRLITGGPSRRDLVLAEHAVRGLILYPRVVPRGGEFPESLREATSEVGAHFAFPTFSTDDPSIPPPLREELASAPGMLSQYFRDSVQAATGTGGGILGYASSSTDPDPYGILALPDGSSVRVPMPAVGAVLEASLDRQQRAIELLLAYLGGAALFGRRTELPPSHPRAFGGLLTRIDDWYDPPPSLGYNAVEIRLPPFLQIVLSRASRRTEIVEVVLSLRSKLIRGATRFHQLTARLNQPTTPYERQRIIQEMNAEVFRWNALVPVADHQRRVRIRGVAIRAVATVATTITAVLADVDPRLIVTATALAAAGIVSDATGTAARFDRSVGLSGSLADRLHSELQRASRQHSREVLKKHLTDAELLVVDQPET